MNFSRNILLLFTRSFRNLDRIFRGKIWIWWNFNVESLYCWLEGNIKLFFSSSIFSIPIETLNNFFCSVDLLIFCIYLKFPICYHINNECHWWPNLCDDSWWLNTGNNLMLKFSNNRVHKENGCLCRVE